uniref:Uncharacterized protein n=1 Tax=Panagrolaimus sp. ES5 TaxID=591445 RepID=A0AC34EZV0_9BILA
MAAVTASNINLVQLEEALEVDSENLEQLQYWYEQLSEVELEGSESPETIELLFRALKWLMQYEHTNAEELKEIAEKEAIELAEKEENWEQEKEILKEELSLLRERITSKAGTDDMNEAFRAEIDSLKAEINHLKQTGRDRDRELADREDKNEELSAKVEAFEKERTLLVQNQSQLEDTIRELNRRITSKSDSSDKDWEARKLKQRSEQAFILSNQLQNAVSQNDHLQVEVERLSSALEAATTLIKETTEKYGTLKEQLSNSEKTIEKLLDDNQNLKKQLALRQSDLVEKIETFELSAKEVEDLIKVKDSQIEKYKEVLNDQLMEIDEQRARLALVKNDEREAELERLRQELVEATKLARQLFGSMSGDIAVGQSLDPTAELRVRIVQLDKQLEIAQKKIAEMKEENKKLEKIAEEKDEINAKINGELERIRKISFGDADEEIKHLERQIRYREEQIEELTTKCSLLQIELQKYEDSPPAKLPSESPKPVTVPKTPPRRRGPIIKKPVQRPPTTIISKPPKIVEIEEDEFEESETTAPPRREISESYLNDVEASAMIISSLNYELMRVLQENEDKERQLKEFEKLTKDHAKDLQLARAKITLLISKYAEIKAQSMISLDIGGSNEEQIAKDSRLQELEIKVIELERLADSIKQSGSEIDRRMEEAARKLVYVQIKNSEFERKIENSERIQKSAGEMNERLRTKLRRLLTGENRKLKALSRDYELSMIEIARLQNVIIHSVPLTQYEKILKAYKSAVHKSTVNGGEYSIENDPAFETDPISNISANFGISNDQSATIIENLSLKNLEIQEINEILESQNEFFRREFDRQQLEIGELKAFLTDIENQTELKSLIVNIERRFLQGIQEQADSSDEQYFSEKELRTVTKNLTARKKAWKQERQNLVGIIVGLQNTVQRLKQQTTSVIRMDHLIQIKESAEKLKDKERNLNQKEELIDKKISDLSIRESFVESQAGAIKTVMDADFSLQRIQKSIQGYEFNVLALSNELKTAKNEIENLKKQLENNENELQELRRENNDLLSMKMDFSQFEQQEEDESKSEEEEKNEENRREKSSKRRKPKRQNSLINQLPRQLSNAYQNTISESDEEEDSILSTEPSSASERSERKEKTRTVIYDNSKEYQKQMEQVKERARLCIQSYKDQLEQKDSAIDEYKQLLESLRRQLFEKSIKEIEDEPSGILDERPKTSAELLNNVILEEKDREIFALEKEIRKLEDINGELSERLSATTTTSISLEKRNIGCQTDRTDATIITNNNNSTKNTTTRRSREQSSFENDFESESSSSENDSDREDDARTPVPPPDNNPSAGNPRPEANNDDSENDTSESESEGGTTDSGTVEDIEVVRPRRPSRSSSRSSSADNNNVRRRSSETITIAKPPTPTKPQQPGGGGGGRPASSSTFTKPPPLVVAGDDREQVIYGQRNEIRKLRERIGALERKARQLEAERDSWKERNRFGGKREQDPDAESASLRKENERLRRESKNLSRTLENQKHRIDDLEKTLSKRTSTIQSEKSVENWEEKKRYERNLAGLKKKLEEVGSREAELMERLERREKHIEQISREQQGGRNFDGERLQQIVRVLKTEKEGFDQREANMKQEIELWKERGRETMGRLDQSLKENRLLKARLERLSQKVEELEAMHQLPQHPHVPFPSPPKQQPILSPPKINNIQKYSIHTQTTARSPSPPPTPKEIIRYITIQQPVPLPLPSTPSKVVENIREPSLSSPSSNSEDKAEIYKLRKQTRLFELRITELQEEIEETQKRYENLRESYTKVVRVDRERLRDTEKIAAISVLRDKLVAKDKEIEIQRRRINDLERKIFHIENR